MLALAIIALGVPLAINLSARVNAEVRTQARGQADLVAATASDLLGAARRPELLTLARTAASSAHGRVLIVNISGGVLADSAGPAQLGASYESRPEIQRALAGHPVQVQRNSATLGQVILATAVPIIRNGRPVGAVRITQSVAAVHRAVRNVELELALVAVIVLALGLFAGSVIAAQVARPLGRLERVARRVAGGDLAARAVPEGSREQRTLARSFNDMTGQVAQLMQAQRDFVADASHQLRTPLTGLRLRLEEARSIGQDPELRRQLTAGIAEVDRLAETVNELLILSRAGERDGRGEQVDLGELATSVSDRWRAAAAARGIRLTVVRDDDASGWASGADLERVLDALIENALSYSPPETTVTVRSRAGRIEVWDEGPGLEPDELEVVFERFHRGKAGRAGPSGNGLGLSIARALARSWGGDVALQNGPNRGAIAILTIPGKREGLPVLNSSELRSTP